MKKIVSALLISGLGALTAAHSSANDSGVTITPMVGQIWPGDDESLDSSRSASLGLGYKFESPLALELAYLISSPELDGTDSSIDLEQFRLDALYFMSDDEEIQPFALIGVGQQELDFGSFDQSSALFNAGLGIRAELAENFAFRGDIRGIVTEGMEKGAAINFGLQWIFGAGSSKSSYTPAPKKDLDTDGDGVKDSMDNCPSTPSGAIVDATGCAKSMDDDGDGVMNDADQCPDSEAGAKVDELGCYLTISEDVTVSLNVNFANNSEEMVSGVEQIAKVASFMKEYPLSKVVIEGHTDSLGAAAYNQDLSQRRAQAVVDELTATYGIASERVSAIGYGETKPIASNETNEGRAANRRVSAVVKASVEKTIK